MRELKVGDRGFVLVVIVMAALAYQGTRIVDAAWGHRVQTPSALRISARAAAEIPRCNPDQIECRIRRIAAEEGLNQAETDRLIRLGTCESNLRPDAVGDGGKARGVWQIHYRIHHLTREQAHDVDFSTRWTIAKIKAGEGHIWTCWRRRTPRHR